MSHSKLILCVLKHDHVLIALCRTWYVLNKFHEKRTVQLRWKVELRDSIVARKWTFFGKRNENNPVVSPCQIMWWRQDRTMSLAAFKWRAARSSFVHDSHVPALIFGLPPLPRLHWSHHLISSFSMYFDCLYAYCFGENWRRSFLFEFVR